MACRFAEFRNSIRDETAVQRLRQSFAQSRINVSEAEVDAALAAQAGGSQYHLAHILVALAGRRHRRSRSRPGRRRSTASRP